MGDARRPPNLDPGPLLDSFRYAFRGVWFVFRFQRNARIHLLAIMLVVALGLWLRVSILEWVVLFLAIGLVIAVEMLNSALEALADAAVPSFHPLIGRAKDVAAGAVLVSAMAAVVVGLLVFIPRFLDALG